MNPMQARSLLKFARGIGVAGDVVERPRPPKVPGISSKPKRDLEGEFAFVLKAHGIGGYHRQFRFHPVRKWAADFAWPVSRFIVDIDGMLFKPGPGGHTSPAGIRRDYERDLAAMALGYRVLRLTSEMIESPEVIAVVRQYVGDGSQETTTPEQSGLTLGRA